MYCLIGIVPVFSLYEVALQHHAALVLSHYLHKRTGNCNLTESFEAEALSRLQSANGEE
jgi:hypothetical protein